MQKIGEEEEEDSVTVIALLVSKCLSGQVYNAWYDPTMQYYNYVQ